MSRIGDCPICRDTLVKPRGLPCLHYFCTNCLQQYIDNTDLKHAGFKCPCCRKLYVLDNKLPVGRLAESFPIANLVSELLIMSDIKRESEKMFPPSLDYCNNCIQNSAIAFCMDCQFNLCFGCYHKHLQENHMVNKKKNCLSSPFTTCLKHKKTTPEFCYKCLMFTCPDCAASNHAACKEEDTVKPCEEAVEKLKERNQINIAKLESLQTHYGNELRNLSKILNEMQKNESNVEGSDHCHRLKKLDDEMVEIQHLLRKINYELECLKLHQKTENPFLYLHEYTSLFKLNETNKERFNLISHSPAQNSFP